MEVSFIVIRDNTFGKIGKEIWAAASLFNLVVFYDIYLEVVRSALS